VPTAPRSVHAVAGHASATLSWLAPWRTGGAPITGYVATSHPASRTCKATRTKRVVTGLRNGTSYTFTVKARNKAGYSANSKPSNKVTPKAVPVTTTTASSSVAFSGKYTGTLSLIIVNNNSTSASPTVTSISGTGTGTDLGTGTLSGSGQVPTTSTNAGFTFTGSGTLAGSNGSLDLSVVSSSANAPDGAGTVTLSGTAEVTGGTGVFATASGTLKFTGSFVISGVDSGSQTPAFTSTLSGTVSLKS